MVHPAFSSIGWIALLVAYVEICSECSNYRTLPELSHPLYLSALERLCRDLKLPVLARAEDYKALKTPNSR